jgi:hypothetical protein
MTDRERQFANLGWEYAEGIDRALVVIVPSTGREIRRTARGTWEAQPFDDNYWREFEDLLDAAKFATRPTARSAVRELVQLTAGLADPTAHGKLAALLSSDNFTAAYTRAKLAVESIPPADLPSISEQMDERIERLLRFLKDETS